MIKSMKRSMISTMIKSMVNPDSAAITRYFAQLDSVQQSHFVYANTLVFAAGDTYKIDFLAPTGVLTTSQYIFDMDDSHPHRGYAILSGGTGNFSLVGRVGQLKLDGSIVGLTSSYPTDGKMHTLEFTMSANMTIKYLASRFTLTEFYNGILASAVATIGGVTTTNPIGLAPSVGNVEQSLEGNNALTYVNIPDANREQFKLSADATQWDNISPLPQELPVVIEIA